MDARHLQVLEEKQTAWLTQHPWLLRVSRMQVCGMPGELVTNTGWHVMKAVSGHHRQATIGPQLPLAAEPVWGLHQGQQQCRPKRTD